jgi:hypothetical protein
MKLLSPFAFVALLAPILLATGGTKPYGKLEWGDFQGPVPPNSPNDAESHVSTGYSYGSSTITPDGSGGYTATPNGLTTSAEFDKRKSWVKPGSQTPELLEHEQYHFDIAQHWAKELEKLQKGVTGSGATPQAASDDLNKKLDEKAAACNKDCEALQDAYDKETDHGTNAEKQKEWCKKITDLLNTAAPNTDVGEGQGAAVVGQNQLVGATSVSFPPAFLASFSCGGLSFQDPLLAGGALQLPPLEFVGYHMGGVNADLMPLGADDVALTDVNGAVVLTGHLRLFMSDVAGTTYTGWIEGSSIDPLAAQQSVLLGLIDAALATGTMSLSVALALPTTLEAASGDWTHPAFVPGVVTIGSVLEPSPWSDLGFALAGTLGDPNLFGVGSLEPGAELTLVVNSIPRTALVYLVAGAAPLYLPLFGGTLVPVPTLVLGPFPTDADGNWILSAALDAGVPSGSSFYLQGWMLGGGGPAGISATNGLLGVVP